MKKKITKSESLQVIALLTLANQSYRKMCDYEEAIYPILGITDDMDKNITDYYMEDRDIDLDNLFKDLGIEVK